MEMSQLLACQDLALDQCSQSQAKFNHLLTTVAMFKNYSVENILILSEMVQDSEAVLMTADEIKAEGYMPDPEDKIGLIGPDKTITYVYNLNKYKTLQEDTDEDPSASAKSAEWFDKMNSLFVRFRKGTTLIPSLFTGIKWEKCDPNYNVPRSFIVDNNGRKDLIISAKKDQIGLTFWSAIKACVLELFNKNAGFDGFSTEIKEELAGFVAQTYLKEQLLGVSVSGLPVTYLKKYTDPEDFKSYINLILITFRLISPDNISDELNQPEQKQTGLKSDDLFAMGTVIDEDLLGQINKANNDTTGSDESSSGGFVPAQTEEQSESFEPDEDEFKYNPDDDAGFV